MPTYKPTQKHSKSLLIIQIASLIGILDAAYLSYVHLFKVPIYCTPGLGHCEVVNSSRYAQIMGIPVAIIGLAGYLAIFLLAACGKRIRIADDQINLLLFGMSLFGFMFSLYLTYLELFVIRAVCQWCMLSALLMITIFILSISRIVVKSARNLSPGGN